MVIEKVHGLHATTVSLNDRFSMLANAAPNRVTNVAMRQRRRASVGSVLTRNYKLSNRYLIDQVAKRLELQARRQALRQRLGLAQGLRRFGSEGNLPGLRRSNSFGNLNQSVKNRVQWRQSNGNLSRASSFTNLNNAMWRARTLRGFRRCGGGRGRGGQRRGVNRPAVQTRTDTRGQTATRSRGRARGRGRGVTRSQSQTRKLLSKEELDAQLDKYMACTKSALDQELDNYMKNAMEMDLQ